MAPDGVVLLQLPPGVIGRLDVRHLQHELEEIENFLQQARIRQPGHKVMPPRASHLLEELTSGNKINLLQAEDRQQLAIKLQALLDTAPTMHVSFASDPSAGFTMKIVAWIRANVHPQALVDVGLQPGIAAGCIVRTPNHVFDFSLREHFSQQRSLLTQAFEAVDTQAIAPSVPPVAMDATPTNGAGA